MTSPCTSNTWRQPDPSFALDQRGHGESAKLGELDAYSIDRLVSDLASYCPAIANRAEMESPCANMSKAAPLRPTELNAAMPRKM